MEETEEITEHDVMVDDVERGNKVKFMLQHPGWREIIGPMLHQKRESLLRKLLGENLKPEEFMLVRQSINAQDALVEFIKAIVRRGEQAVEGLKDEEVQRTKENEE